MAKQTPAEIYKDIACAVIASGMVNPDGPVAEGDVVADERVARHARAASLAMYAEIAEEMAALEDETP